MKQKLAVFCGGISPERDVSLVSGKNVFDALKDKFDAVLVRLDENKLPDGPNPADTVIYPAMHGDYGEDGTLQEQLEAAGFSYAGCGPLSDGARNRVFRGRQALVGNALRTLPERLNRKARRQGQQRGADNGEDPRRRRSGA